MRDYGFRFATGEDPVHRCGALLDHWSDLLAVDRLCDRRAAVADEPGDVFERHTGGRQQ